MAGTANTTTYDALFKEVWPQDDIYDILIDAKQTFFGLVPKDTAFTEKTRHIAVGIGHTQGLSAKFDQAKNNMASTVQKEFKITPVTYYSFFSLQRIALRRSKSKKASILEMIDRETRSAIYGWKRVQGEYMGNISGIGDLARLASFSGSTLTLAGDPSSVTKHFSAGMTLELSVDNTGVAGTYVSTSPLRIVSVDREAGTILCNQAIATAVPGAVQTSYVYRAGDYASIVSGMYAWVPIATPTSTAFFGLDRTTEPQRLGGWRVNCKNLSVRASLQKTLKVLKENGADPNKAFLSPNDYLNLQNEIQSSGVVKSVKEPAAPIGKYKFGVPFEGIEIMGPAGPVSVMFDINVQDNYPLVTQMNTWTYGSMGDVPYFDETDGNRILREVDADAYSGRLIGDGNLYNEAPGFSAIALLRGA